MGRGVKREESFGAAAAAAERRREAGNAMPGFRACVPERGKRETSPTLVLNRPINILWVDLTVFHVSCELNIEDPLSVSDFQKISI